ncbi:MAG: hypothetical protein M3619_10385, partial [Myxococcota bacterium]|nr:hypothetical protein [Myxococcota bacterium]
LTLVIVDVEAKELVAKRDVTIPDARVARQLGGELKKFLSEGPVERAKTLFDQGNQHYNLGEFAKALESYKRAYRVKALPAFLFNIAQCHRKLGHHGEAIQMYQSYLVGLPNADNKGLVESLITESQSRIADGQRHERARQAAELEAGKQRAEHARKTKEAEARAEAERRKITQAKLDAERARELDRTYNQHPARKWTIVSGIIGVAAIGTGGYFGLRTRNLQSEFDNAGCGDPSINTDQATLATCDANRHEGQRNARLATVLLASGGALFAASVVVFIVDPGNVSRPPRERARVAISPTSIQVVMPW